MERANKLVQSTGHESDSEDSKADYEKPQSTHKTGKTMAMATKLPKKTTKENKNNHKKGQDVSEDDTNEMDSNGLEPTADDIAGVWNEHR
jgi:hypothetical protein